MIHTVITQQGQKYKLPLSLLIKYSSFFENLYADQIPTVEKQEEQANEQNSDQKEHLSQSEEEEPDQTQTNLPHISGPTFDYIYEFLQLHKKLSPKAISKPILTHQPLTKIMLDHDAELIERIKQLKPERINAILDATQFLGIESMKKHIVYGVLQEEFKGTDHSGSDSSDEEGHKRHQKRLTGNSKELERQIHDEIEEKIVNFLKMEDLKNVQMFQSAQQQEPERSALQIKKSEKMNSD